ncbi:aminopeptidase P family protein [Cryptosporangium phraense]|uniref:Aminopeptidase P family protein n=1 Tax=Cryptosporangium phraense TaxID=2593070 RepID=A0A545AUA8_9ACTN|nr:aminopeptidase P family protein [Cryptosporangium phraense]
MDVSAVTRFLAESEATRNAVDPDIPFSREEYAARLTKLRAAMAEDGIRTLLLFSPEAMCWLHGLSLRWYKSGAPRQWRPLTCSAVHVDSDTVIQFEGYEHQEMIRRTSVAQDVRLLPRYERAGMLDFIVRNLKDEGWTTGTVGVEKYSYVPNPAVAAQVDAALTAAGATVVDASDAIRRVRRLKSPAEIAYIEKAAEICDAGLLHLREVLAPGMTELEAWAEMVIGMARAGGEPAALHELAVVTTPAGGLGHAIAGRRVLRAGDWLEVDPCGVYNHYHANRNAFYYLGEPPEIAVELMTFLGGAYDVLTGTAKVGTPVREVARALREYYQDAGVWELNSQYWVGGYELGISFPPDWVGEWLFTVNSDEDQGVIEDGLVTNYESIIGLGLLDTIVYQTSGTRTLSTIPYEILSVPC